MNISGIQAYQQSFFSASGKAAAGHVIANRNLGPDTVRISPEAMAKINAYTGEAAPEMSGMGKLISGRLKSWVDAAGQTGTHENDSEILPLNYSKLQAIEAEIANGNDSRELQDRKLLLTLFGDVKELSEYELDEGVALLKEFMPSGDKTLEFGEIVSLLRKAYGVGDAGEGVRAAEDGESADGEGEDALSPETKLFLEELQGLLDKAKGLSVEITLNGNAKKTAITRGPDKNGKQAIAFSIKGSIYKAGLDSYQPEIASGQTVTDSMQTESSQDGTETA